MGYSFSTSALYIIDAISIVCMNFFASPMFVSSRLSFSSPSRRSFLTLSYTVFDRVLLGMIIVGGLPFSTSLIILRNTSRICLAAFFRAATSTLLISNDIVLHLRGLLHFNLPYHFHKLLLVHSEVLTNRVNKLL